MKTPIELVRALPDVERYVIQTDEFLTQETHSALVAVLREFFPPGKRFLILDSGMKIHPVLPPVTDEEESDDDG